MRNLKLHSKEADIDVGLWDPGKRSKQQKLRVDSYGCHVTNGVNFSKFLNSISTIDMFAFFTYVEE